MGSCMASAIVHLQNQFMPGCIAAHSRDAQVEGSCRLRPSDARHLVGNGNGDELGRLLGQQPYDPGMLLRMLPGISNNGCCTVDEQPSEIAISLLGDAAEPLLAPRRVLPRHESDPCCKIPTRFEVTRVCDSGSDRRSSNHTY